MLGRACRRNLGGWLSVVLLVSATGGLLAIVGERPAAAARRWTVKAEAGPEYDSNALRVAQDARSSLVGSPLLRASGDLAFELDTARHALALGYSGGAKLFLRGAAAAAHEYVHRATLGTSWHLSPVRIGVQGSYYEVFQPPQDDPALRALQRDLRLATGLLRSSSRQHGLWPALVVDLGYQAMHFKPDDDFDFHGPLGSASARWGRIAGEGAGASVWTFAVTFTLGRRWFNGLRTVCARASEGGCFHDLRARRADWDQLLWLQLGYEGPATALWWYGIELNGSNSDDQRYVRHIVGMRFTVPLIWSLYASAESVLQVSNFRRSVALEPTNQPFNPLLDEENRSRLSAYVGRELGRRWAVVARWTVYVNESIAATRALTRLGFFRQTLFAGLRYTFDSEAR